MGEAFSKLLLLSAPFPPENGQGLPSRLSTARCPEQSTDLWVWAGLLTLGSYQAAAVCLVPLSGGLLLPAQAGGHGSPQRNASEEPIGVW